VMGGFPSPVFGLPCSVSCFRFPVFHCFLRRHLCRYILRPPIAQEALELTPEGKILLRLRRPWSDGTRGIRLEPGQCVPGGGLGLPRGAAMPRMDFRGAAAGG